MSDTSKYQIKNLDDVKQTIAEYARKLQPVYPRCLISRLDVISHQNMIHQFYNLLYNDRPMITISARSDDVEFAFRESDGIRNKNPKVSFAPSKYYLPTENGSS